MSLQNTLMVGAILIIPTIIGYALYGDLVDIPSSKGATESAQTHIQELGLKPDGQVKCSRCRGDTCRCQFSVDNKLYTVYCDDQGWCGEVKLSTQN